MQDTEERSDDIEQTISANEGRSESGAWLIVIGLLIEIALAFCPHDTKSSWEIWGSIGATILIAAGVYAEIHFGRRVGHALKSSRLAVQIKLANALNRAAIAEEKLLKFLTARSKTFASNKLNFVARVSAYRGTPFDTGLDAGGESMHFLWDLITTLQSEGWVHTQWQDASGIYVKQNPYISGSVHATNVEIHIHPQSLSALLPVATELVSALQEAGIDASILGPNIHSTNVNALHILVGPKG